MVVPFLRHGLEGGEKVLYILDARDVETILDYLREDGLDPDPYLERGQLSVLTSPDVYLKDGVFNPDAMIALLRAETDQALAEGYAALRLTGEMSWALRGLPGSERLIEYEAKLSRFFPGSKCLAICQYDRRAFSAPLLLDVLSTHPIAVIGTSVHDNLYYVPPDALLGPDPQAARLRAWTRTLVERKDGSQVPVEPHASSALDENGEVDYLNSFHADTSEHRRADEALRHSEANVKALLNAPFDSALLCELDGTIVDLNEPAATRMGATRGELLGKNIFDSFPPELAAQRKTMGQSVVASGKPVRFQDERDGMCFDISVYPVFDSQGAAVRVAVFASDITERKRAEQELERAHARTEAIIHAVPDMMFVVGRDGTYIDFIPAEEKEPLFSSGEFLGRTVTELMPAELARRTMDLIEATLESGEMQSMEYELDTSDGRGQYECRIVVAGEDRVLAIVRDVTAQKLLAQQEERRRARDELEGKVERKMLGRNPYGLTFREFSVLHLVALGEADKEIADELGVSTFTVNKHVANILGKMNASSRTEASVRAHREGLIS